MTATLHQMPSIRTSFDPDAMLKELRLAGVTEVDEMLRHVHERLALSSAEAAGSQPEFERSLREQTMAVERACHLLDLKRLVPTSSGMILNKERYIRQPLSNLAVLLISGWILVPRHLYRVRGGHGGETIDPLARRIGLVAGSTTLAASRIISRESVSATEAEAAAAIAEHGGLKPSSSHVGRVMKALGEGFEAKREEVEEAIRMQELVQQQLPARGEVALIAWSLDGIMVRMKDAPNTPGANKEDETPKGHREAASATVALYNAEGTRLHTIGLARMPESKKVTLHAQLEAELGNVVDCYPEATLVVVADAAKENWRIIDAIERRLGIRSDRVLDYFHAKDHLVTGLKLSGASKAMVDAWKDVLLNEPDGAEQCLTELVRRRQFAMFDRNIERAKKADAEITYFNNNAHMMSYEAMKARNLPIGSGIQEAACKSLIAARCKRSGMSWLRLGGQAVLTFRSLDKSGRFDLAWAAIEGLFRQPYERYEVDPSDERKKPSWARPAAA
jgi:hypothetical protein